MKRTLMTRVLISLLAAALLPARALSADSSEALPGMAKEGGGDAATPRMAQESAQDKSTSAQQDGTSRKEAADAQGQPPADSSAQPAPDGSMPSEVVIKGAGTGKLKVNKPPLNLSVDPFESIRDSLKPEQQLLLAESPLTVVWRRTHPEFLKSQRVIEPWLTIFSERPGIVFSPRDQLAEVLQRKIDDKEAKAYQWSLTIADEDGKVFQHYEGSNRPPEELLWSGQNDQGEWITAGRAYSPVYMFTDPGGTPYTRVGIPLRYKGIVHQERDGMHVSLDSSELWGKGKGNENLQKDGLALLRAAADLIKRRFTGLPIRVEDYAGSKELADRQAAAIQDYLLRELRMLPQDISTDSLRAPYSEQRVEIVLLNR